MKNLIRCLAIAVLLSNYHTTKAQCPVENAIVESTFDASLTCWSLYNGAGGVSGGEMNFYNPGNNFIVQATLPRVKNAKGVISLDVRRFNQFFGSNEVRIGTMPCATCYSQFNELFVINAPSSYTFVNHTFDLSGYTGTDQYIALRSNNSTNSTRTRIDNLYYRSQCAGTTAAIAVTQDITLTLDVNGEATITPESIDDGSQDSCGDAVTLNLDRTVFNCNDLGDNTVTLTATDTEGNTGFETATVTIYPYVVASTIPDLTVELDANGEASITVADIDDGTFSACGDDAFSMSIDNSDFDCTQVGNTSVVTLTATDDYGNVQMSTTSVSIEDSIDPVMVAQDITVALDESTGIVAIEVDDIDDGSYDNCNLTLSLSQSSFTCSHVGDNMIRLNGMDAQGNTFSADATVTITTTIVDHPVTTTVADFCPGGSTTAATVDLESSTLGFNYTLRNSANNSTVDGPIEGTGSALSFDAGSLTETTTFHVYAEPAIEPNYALDMDGTDDYVQAPLSSTFAYETTHTIEAWVLSTSPAVTGNNEPIIFMGTDAVSDIEVYVQASTNELVISYNRGKSSTVPYMRFPSPPFGEWYHLAITFDGSDIQVYYNGVFQSRTIDLLTESLTRSTGAFMDWGYISSSAFNAAEKNMTGSIDEIRLWSTVRTYSEIISNMNESLEGTETGLVAYYNLDEGSGTTATDLVAGNNGTMTNMDPATDWIEGALGEDAVCGLRMSSEVTIGDGTPPTVVLMDLTVQQNDDGTITVSAEDFDNGSTDNCSEASVLDFQFEEATWQEEQKITATSYSATISVTDEAGNTASSTVTLIVESCVNDETVTVSEGSLCPVNNGATVTLGSSMEDHFYFLRSSTDDNIIVDGPVAGTGGEIEFSTGSIEETTTFNVLGSIGTSPSSEASSLEFEKGNQYIAAGEDTDFAYDQGYTFETWVNSAFESSSSHALLSYSTSSTSDIEIYVQGNTRRLTIVHGRVNGSVTTYYQYNTPPADQWTHIAVTCNGNNSGVQVYYDGAEQTRVFEYNPSGNIVKRSGATLNIGRSLTFSSSNDNFSGQMDEVRIWNSARTLTEITDNMNSCLTGAEDGLVNYFPFNEGQGTMAEDMAGGNDGVLTNMDPSTDWLTQSPLDCQFCEFQMTEEVTINIQDLTDPEVFTQDVTVLLDDNGEASISPDQVNDNSVDNCTDMDDLVMSLDISTFDIDDLGENTVTLTVTDASGNSATGTSTVTVSDKEQQVITFDVIDDKTFGDADFSISASSDSGLPVSFTVVEGAVTINGTTVSISSAGTVTIRAYQDGDDNYAAAELDRTFIVSKADQEITIDDIADVIITAASFDVSASVDSDLTLDYQVISGPATISNTTVTLDGTVGTVLIEVSQTGNDNYNAASEQIEFAVLDKEIQEVTFTGIVNKTFGDPDFNILAETDSGLPIQFTVLSGVLSITESAVGLTGGGQSTFQIDGAGEATIRANNDGDDTYLAFQEDFTIQIAKSSQTITIGAIADQVVTTSFVTLSASVDSDLPLTYEITGPATISESVITLTGTLGTVEVTVNQVGNDNYYSASESISFEVIERDAQTITFDAIADVIYGSDDILLSAASDSGLPISYTIIEGNAFLNDNILSITQIGDITVKASQAGNDTYLEATSVQRSFTVNPANLTITANDQEVIYGEELPLMTYSIVGFVNGEGETDLDFTISATTTASTVGLPDAGSYPINISIDPSDVEGSYTVNTVDGELLINKADQTIQIDALDDKESTDGPFDVVASVDSGLPLTFDLSGPATLSGSTVTLTGEEGMVTVTVEQIGDINYNPASLSESFEVSLILSANSIMTNGKEKIMNLYPLPAHAKITISLSRNFDRGYIIVHDLHGHQMMEMATNGVLTTYDISQLPKGMYFFSLLDEENKIIKTDKVLIH